MLRSGVVPEAVTGLCTFLRKVLSLSRWAPLALFHYVIHCLTLSLLPGYDFSSQKVFEERPATILWGRAVVK